MNLKLYFTIIIPLFGLACSTDLAKLNNKKFNSLEISSSKSFSSNTKDELLYLSNNKNSQICARGFRYADDDDSFVYKFNFGSKCLNAIIAANVYGEYLIEGSSNNHNWTTLFNAGNNHRGCEFLIFNPFNKITKGHGALTITNSFFPNLYKGVSNVFFLRISDCDSNDGWGALVQDLTIMPDVEGFLGTSSKSFSLSNHIISTSFFPWYSETAGQKLGPWIPIEGRENWTGAPDWWKSQIKQVMLANIDLLYVLLIPEMELQRVNLFRALFELRQEGYDVPKVAPFLDPIITWRTNKFSLSIESNRQKIVDRYICFFDQYFDVNTDKFANDYIGIIDNRVVLNTWHLLENFSNIPSFKREYLESKLAEKFAANHPVFSNGIYQITTDSPASFSFADEKVMQFQIHEYQHLTEHNGIRAYQLKPGYWDQNVRDPGYNLKRNGGANYSNAWTFPNPLKDQRIYIESWNEYDEGSGIFAANPLKIFRVPENNGTDLWSNVDDPFEYIKTTFKGARKFKSSEINPKDSKILFQNIPTKMVAGQTNFCSVFVRNTGFDLWKNEDGFCFGQNSNELSFGAKKFFFNDAENEVDFYLGIFKGRPVKFNLQIIAPTTPGTYETHWGMFKKNVQFGEVITNTIHVLIK